MKFFCAPFFRCKYADIDTLDYSQQHLEDVPKEVYKVRKTLDELNLNVNKIETLPPEFFRCFKLKKLDVSENKLKSLPPEVGLLQCLMDLNICNNEFVDLPEELGACINLVTLNISTNIVPELPKSIINLTQMTSLVISNNPLTQLPSDIDKLINLQHLDAGQCELRFLPPTIVQLRRLRILDLCENYLTELPDEMNGLASLETLDIRKNMLAAIPPGLLGCSALRNLDLADNSIMTLPLNIGDLTRLNELSLCDNKICSIPSSIGQMKYLESLKVARNTLTSLTPAICSCYELRDLSLANNKLTELPSSLGNLKKLRFFDVSNNLLTSLPSTIGGCSSLGVLSLRQNKLTNLPMEVGRLENLKVLDVAGNDLTYLPYTITVLYEAKNIAALWLALHQPPLPKLTPTYEPLSNVKVLTCCYLPQSDEKALGNRIAPKSCTGGTRVCFSSQLGSTNDGSQFVHEDNDDDEDKLPIGKFERYDTPHPKPFAPKNRLSRNSGDFTQVVSTESNTEACSQESRPLRSVLKKRPVSTYSVNSQDEATLISQLNESRTKTIQFERDPTGFGWSLVGGQDSVPYKGKAGVYISNVTKGGAAERAGFQVDDRLLCINGTTMSALNHLDIVQLISEAGPSLEVKIERIPEDETTDLEANLKLGSLDHKRSNSQNPTASLELDLPIMLSEPRPASRQFSSAIPPPINNNPPLAEAESSGTTPPGLSPLPTHELKPSQAPDIIALVLKRDQSGSAGFSVAGTGNSDDPIRISCLTPNGLAQQSGKLAVGDRIRSVNGVDVRNASHERVMSLLKSTSDICLVVERTASTQFPVHGSLTHAQSLPTLVANKLYEHESFIPPPLPPRKSSSRSALFDRTDLSKFDFKSMLKDRTCINNEIPAESVVNAVKMANPNAENVVFSVQHGKPLATSSPIPPQMNAPKVPIAKVKTKVEPPPVAPKPKIKSDQIAMPERMHFKDKLQSFESMSTTSIDIKKAPPKQNGFVPLVSEQDWRKQQEYKVRQVQLNNSINAPPAINEPEALPMDYEQLLVNSVGPSVIRTKKAESRASRLAFNQDELKNDPMDLVNPTDSLEDLEADLRKRKMWRQARMDSMDAASENGDQVIQLIKSVTPIPT